MTPIPAAGSFELSAKGTAPTVTFARAGPTKILVGDFDLRLTPRDGYGNVTRMGTMNALCTVNPEQDVVLHSLDTTKPVKAKGPEPRTGPGRSGSRSTGRSTADRSTADGSTAGGQPSANQPQEGQPQGRGRRRGPPVRHRARPPHRILHPPRPDPHRPAPRPLHQAR
ncbi:DUF6801 domain-containing protein [Streptomyces sp. NPDC093085]|uniref:DUF6801 domain-containing protein n=1 Tax=Streptomyces sp. NPDC093085 TaxID=3155068 RepID=UPI00342EA45B